MSEYYEEFKSAYEKDGFTEGEHCAAVNAKYTKQLAENVPHQPGRATYSAVSAPPNSSAETHEVGRDTNAGAITGNGTYAYRGDSNNNNRNSEEK